MLTAKQIADAARRLDTAERERKQIGLLSLQYPQMTMADAYAVQAAWMKLKMKRGLKIRGHKIGLTSRAMQRQLAIDEPDFGLLLDDMFFDDGGAVPTNRFIATRVEMELAFILNRDLSGPRCTLFDVLAATEFISPAIEILDTRIVRVDPETKQARKVFDTISDNAANAGIILGGRAVRPMDIDLRWVSGLLYKNGVIEESGVAAAVLNHPANGIAWLANRLSLHGESLRKGEVVLAGSFISAVEAWQGDTIQADFGPLGQVTCRFV